MVVKSLLLNVLLLVILAFFASFIGNENTGKKEEICVLSTISVSSSGAIFFIENIEIHNEYKNNKMSTDTTFSNAPESLIGYTELRTNLPGGRQVNVSTSRAVVLKSDGSGHRCLADDLTGEPNTSREREEIYNPKKNKGEELNFAVTLL